MRKRRDPRRAGEACQKYKNETSWDRAIGSSLSKLPADNASQMQPLKGALIPALRHHDEQFVKQRIGLGPEG